ncbi:hypothetical protein FACS189459_6030 [Bacilli bacterium]|nr:hypothetical protein FACS189459_6030 [Bacilli bacterium]
MENNKMQDNHEYEAKFFLENEIDFINKLYQLGFKETMKLTTMKRKIFGIQDAPKYFRVRDEGNKITMACKICSDSTIHGTEEYEITISDFNKGCKILELSGLPLKSFQETRRQIFEKDGVEIMIDE